MRTDWGKIESDYMAGKLSYREIARKYGISASSVARHGAKNGWPEKRAQFAGRVQTRARQKAADKRASREAEALLRVEALGEKLLSEMEKALGDDKQLYRHVLTEGRTQREQVIDKLDTQALKDMAAVLTGIGKMMGELGGIMTKKDAESVKIARERLRMDKRREKRELAGEKPQEVRLVFEKPEEPMAEAPEETWDAYSG